LLQALKVIERLAPDGFEKSSDAWYETMADVVYAVFGFRERWPIHAVDFTPSVRRWLLGDELAGELANGIRCTSLHEPLETGDEPPGDTTHLSVADTQGNVVALTQSVQSLFGSKVAHPKLGFFYNNYLVTCPRYRHPSQLAGGCTPRSNVTPTLVMARDSAGSKTGGDISPAPRPVLAIGAAGSRRIISATLQVLSGILDGGGSRRPRSATACTSDFADVTAGSRSRSRFPTPWEQSRQSNVTATAAPALLPTHAATEQWQCLGQFRTRRQTTSRCQEMPRDREC
jgi:gamma-glutamyltranspeptidase/glutathione hydrolase